MNNELLTVTVLSLKEIDNFTLAVANNALNGFGKIGAGTLAYKTFFDLKLIDEGGLAYEKEILLNALSFVINDRVEKGLFV